MERIQKEGQKDRWSDRVSQGRPGPNFKIKDNWAKSDV